VHPDWLGSPQHLVGGLALSLVAAWLARGRSWPWWIIATLAIGVTMTAETAIEILEYPLLYAGEPHLSAYYDTIADLTATLAGALIGTSLALAGGVARRRRA
jgi:hypothetical protein